MTRVRYVANPLFEEELQATAEFEANRDAITRGVADAIKLAAEPFRNTGRFIRFVRPRRDRIYLEPQFWHLSEYGSMHPNNPPQGNVRRGTIAAGLRFEDARAELT